jgi:hypothetical protein
MTMVRLAKPRILCIAVLLLLGTAASAAAGRTFAQTGQVAPDAPSPPGASAPAPAVPQPAPPAPPTSGSPTAAAPASPAQPPAAERPGFLHQLKDWWDNSIAVFDPRSKDAHGPADDLNKTMDDAAKGTATATQDAMKNAVEATKGAAATATDAMKNAVEATKGAATTATDAMKNAVEATKNAADAIARLPGTRVVDVHETCAKAANGASDCAAAAANGCRGKGYSGGSPLDVRSAEKCGPKPPQGGNHSAPVACANETVVMRAVCQ